MLLFLSMVHLDNYKSLLAIICCLTTNKSFSRLLTFLNRTESHIFLQMCARVWRFNGCALEFGDSTDVLNNLLFRYAKFHTDVCDRRSGLCPQRALRLAKPQVGDLLLSV